MKRVSMMVIIISMSMLLLGCINNHISTTSLNPEEVKANIEDMIYFYIDKLIELGGIEDELLESEIYYESSNEKILLSSGYTEYDKDNLPEQVVTEYLENGIDPELMIITTDTLNEFMTVLLACETFLEDEYFTLSVDELEYTMKFSVNGNELYIESYRHMMEDPDFLAIDLMYFDLVVDKVVFKYVRDYRSSEDSYMYYDEFSETGDIISIALNVDQSMFILYQIYDRERNMTFELSNTFIHGVSMGYNASDGSIFYGIEIDDAGNINRYSMRYGGFPQNFWYVKENEQISLMWNLYLAEGWNKCWIDSSGYDYIFLNDTRLLEDFNISISIADRYANARIIVPDSAFTENVMNMTDYGLMFDAVTFAELNADIEYIEQNYQSIIEMYGLSIDMEDNYEILYDVLPFTANESIVEDILE